MTDRQPYVVEWVPSERLPPGYWLVGSDMDGRNWHPSSERVARRLAAWLRRRWLATELMRRAERSDVD